MTRLASALAMAAVFALGLLVGAISARPAAATPNDHAKLSRLVLVDEDGRDRVEILAGRTFSGVRIVSPGRGRLFELGYEGEVPTVQMATADGKYHSAPLAHVLDALRAGRAEPVPRGGVDLDRLDAERGNFGPGFDPRR